MTRLGDALSEVQKLGGTDPFSGDKLKKDTYGTALEAIASEADAYHATVGKLKEELTQARAEVGKATAEFDKLSKKLEETVEIEPLRTGHGQGAFVVVKAYRP